MNYINVSNNQGGESAPIASMVRHSPDERDSITGIPGSIPGQAPPFPYQEML